MSPAPDVAVAPARMGVAGNPADALGGAVLAVPVPSFVAAVEVHSSDRLRIRGGPDGWASVSDLVGEARRFGHEGASRLVSAAVVTLAEHLTAHGRPPDPAPFELRWRTSIPRSVGLAGSSALVVATIRALGRRWGVELAPSTVARLALAAEVDQLGIAAGWQDRMVQSHGVPVLVDTRRMVDGAPSVTPVRPARNLELVVAWDPDGAAPSGRLHSELRRRRDAGDPEVAGAVERLTAAALSAAGGLAKGDRAAVAAAVDATWRARRGLGAVDDVTARLVEVAAGRGAAATSAGSGGSVTCVPAQDAGELVAEFAAAGCRALVVDVSPTLDA